MDAVRAKQDQLRQRLKRRRAGDGNLTRPCIVTSLWHRVDGAVPESRLSPIRRCCGWHWPWVRERRAWIAAARARHSAFARGAPSLRALLRLALRRALTNFRALPGPRLAVTALRRKYRLWFWLALRTRRSQCDPLQALIVRPSPSPLRYCERICFADSDRFDKCLPEMPQRESASHCRSGNRCTHQLRPVDVWSTGCFAAAAAELGRCITSRTGEEARLCVSLAVPFPCMWCSTATAIGLHGTSITNRGRSQHCVGHSAVGRLGSARN